MLTEKEKLAMLALLSFPRSEDDELVDQIAVIPTHFADSVLNDMQITRVMNSVSAGTSEQKSTVLDMQGYDSVCFIVLLNTVTSTDVFTATIKSNTANSTSTPTPVAETNASATFTDSGGASSNNMVIVDLFRPLNRYLFLDITRTTANAAIDGVVAIQYNSKAKPQTQGSTVQVSQFAGPND